MFAVSFQFKGLRFHRLAFLLMAKNLRNRFEIVLTAFAVSFITIGLLRWENYVYTRSIWSKESSRSWLRTPVIQTIVKRCSNYNGNVNHYGERTLIFYDPLESVIATVGSHHLWKIGKLVFTEWQLSSISRLFWFSIWKRY